jgi:cell division protease FtsH
MSDPKKSDEPTSREQRKSGSDKQRQNRSFGSFLVFLFVLIIILVVIGGEQVRQPRELTQDQYLYRLYVGDIVTQEFRGTPEKSTRIEGEFRPQGSTGTEPFAVEFGAGVENESLFRELKARKKDWIEWDKLVLGIEGGWYQPLRAQSLTTTLERRDPPAPGREPGATVDVPEPPVRVWTEDRLLVEVLARPESKWDQSLPPQFPLPERSGHLWFEVSLTEGADLPAILGLLAQRGAQLERHQFDLGKDRGTTYARSSNLWSSFLLMVAPTLLIFVVLMFILRQFRNQGGAGGVMNFGRSRAQMYTKENRTNVTFDDVAGAQEAKAEVKEIVEFLKNPSRFTRIGGRIPRGVLLVGPPGCGKTLLAKAIAGEAEVPFFSISGSDFVEMFVGVGASRVRDLFKQARENSPCIIFLDEIDAVGRRRGSGMGGGHDEREQTLNAILVEMDGFSTDEGIIVVAATNRPDVLDPALLRPGRFDREVTIDLPDLEGRKAILEVHLKRVKKSSAVSADVLARSTPGYSGADLAAIVNEAAIMAVLQKRDEISMDDLEESRDKVRYGRQKISRKMEVEDRRITAYHEAGHAVIAAVLEETDPPHKVTIVPRGRALGATMILPAKESFHTQKRRLLGQLAMLFGGRVAEQEFCGDISAGASDDIRRATELARAMVTELGMSERVGPIHYAEREGSDFLGAELSRGKLHSEETAREIDQEVRSILEQAYSRAEAVIRSQRQAMEEITLALLAYETISGDEVRAIVAGKRHGDLRPTPQGGPTEPSPGDPRTRQKSRDGEEPMSGHEFGGAAPSPA